jgi:hypothetical protein
MVSETVIALNSTQHSALSTQHSALSIQHSAFSTQHSALSIQHSAFSTQHSALSIQPNRDASSAPCAAAEDPHREERYFCHESTRINTNLKSINEQTI